MLSLIRGARGEFNFPKTTTLLRRAGVYLLENVTQADGSVCGIRNWAHEA
jgi:hypothetical protein